MFGLGMGAVAGGFLSACQPLTAQNQDQSIHVAEWTGDSFEPMHRIRDARELPSPEPSHWADVVIVGGGLSGLTAAYALKNEAFLLLERESQLGGNAKQGVYHGIPYAMGSAYLVDIAEPYGPLYEALGLTLKPVPSPVDMAYLDARWSPLESGPAAQGFERLKAHFKAYLSRPDFPSVPLHQADPQALKLDRVSFYDYLKKDYPPALLKCIDAYCYSALGGGMREVSAYAGINFYSEIAGNIYAFPGGNAAVAEKLVQQIEVAGAGRMKTGVSVYRIQQNDDHAVVSYFYNNQPGAPQAIRCKAVIMAVPYFFAGRIVAGLSQQQKALMRTMQYGAYLVANCCFRGRAYQGGYDNWTPDNPVFTDFIQADYVSGGAARYPDASVLTVYAPFRQAMAGRAMLLQGNREGLAAQIYRALADIIGFSPANLKEIRLTRYGHQLLTSRVGLMEPLASLEKTLGRVILAHSDGQGMASIESAILEGLEAARQVAAILSR